MENENGTLDWQEFVNSHNERCKAYEEDSTFSVEEAKELLTLIRNGQASNEQIIKFAKLYICNQISECDIDVNKVIPALNGDLQRDFINALGIAIVNGDYVDDSFIESGYGQCFFKEWINTEDVIDNLETDVIVKLARNGCQVAFDWLDLEHDCWLWDYYANWGDMCDFLIGCEDAGVDIRDILSNAIESNDDCVYYLASIGAYERLAMHDLDSYEWIKEHLSESDIVADIAARNINKVIQYKEDIKWLKREADKKVPQAQFLMGVLYFGMSGILEKNESLALRYFQAAEANGCGLTKKYLLKFEEEEKQRLKAAEEAKIKAAEEQRQRLKAAEERKAKAAEEEKQRKKAEAEAVASAKELIRKAENGELAANELFSLAAVLSYGDASKGIKKNTKKASKFYRMAAEQGNAEAQYQLGIHLIEGIGCHKNWNAGIKWLKKSAAQDYSPAKNYLSIQDTFFNRMLHKFIK
jgi:TPR repeat protein